MTDQLNLPTPTTIQGDLSATATTVLGFTISLADIQVGVSLAGLLLGMAGLYMTFRFHSLAAARQAKEIELKERELDLRERELEKRDVDRGDH